jgi:hypothetical protein
MCSYDGTGRRVTVLDVWWKLVDVVLVGGPKVWMKTVTTEARPRSR